jgi:hypothetical protein
MATPLLDTLIPLWQAFKTAASPALASYVRFLPITLTKKVTVASLEASGFPQVKDLVGATCAYITRETCVCGCLYRIACPSFPCLPQRQSPPDISLLTTTHTHTHTHTHSGTASSSPSSSPSSASSSPPPSSNPSDDTSCNKNIPSPSAKGDASHALTI